MARNSPLGGTSAGMAMLGQFDFSTLRSTVTSAHALADPYNKYMTLSPFPLSMSAVEVRKLADSDTVFNLSDWTGATPYHVDAISGALNPTDPY